MGERREEREREGWKKKEVWKRKKDGTISISIGSEREMEEING